MKEELKLTPELKKHYSAPRLLVYGDFRQLTRGGGGVKSNDGGGSGGNTKP
jgi:hypothetical protein